MRYSSLKLALAFSLFVSAPAAVWASYVNSCLLEGVVLEPTSTQTLYVADGKGQGAYEENHLRMAVAIRKAKPDGRADSGCGQFIGQNMTIDISELPRVAFKKGEKIKIRYVAKDFEGAPYWQSYTLVTN